MIYNEETKRFSPVLVIDENRTITRDGVDFNDKYELTYEIEGYGSVRLVASGSELYESVSTVLMEQELENDEYTIFGLIQNLNIFLRMWATKKISEKLFRKTSKKSNTSCVRLVTRAANGKRKSAEKLKEYIYAYFYLLFTTRKGEEVNRNKLHIINRFLSEEEIAEMNWQEQPVVVAKGIKTPKEASKLYKNGVLILDWHM